MGSSCGSAPVLPPREPREPGWDPGWDPPDLPPGNDPEPWEVSPGQLPVGQIGNKFSPYDGLLDEEAEALKKELERQEAKRIPVGFHVPGTHFYRGRKVKDRRKK